MAKIQWPTKQKRNKPTTEKEVMRPLLLYTSKSEPTKIQGAPMRVKMLPAAIDYLLIIGAWFFFIYQDRAKHSEKETIMRAALLGFFIYGIFDMTNLAIIEKYQWDLAIIDSIWGGVLFAVSTAFFFRF